VSLLSLFSMGLCASSDEHQKIDGAAVLSKENIVPNPTFDLHISGEQFPLGWQIQHYQGDQMAKWEDGKGIPHSGDHCLKIESKTGSDNSWFCDIRVEPNTEYQFAGEIKCKDLSGGGGAYFTIATVKDARTESVTGTQNEWKRYGVKFNSGDLSVVRIRAVYGGGSLTTGEAWYDTIDLVKISGAADKEANRVPNPFLHQGVDGKPYGWFGRQVGGAPAELTWATGPGVARVGAYCLSIKADQATDAMWFSDIRVVPGKDYKLSAWIKSADVKDGSGAYFTITNISGVSTARVTGSGDYQQVTTKFNSGKLECVRLCARLGPGTSGQGWYDDIEIVPA